MRYTLFLSTLLTIIVTTSFNAKNADNGSHAPSDTILFPGETHFKNIRQLTFAGDNAEAYFSFDGKYLIFQKRNPKEGIDCDQIWMGKIPTNPNEKFTPKLVSTGTGRTTCSFFYPDGKHILYASTHLGGKECPPVPDRSKYGNKFSKLIPMAIS